MKDRALLREQWQAVASALSIQFISPFTLSLPKGEQREFAGLLPQFGGARGMIVDTQYDHAVFLAAAAAGFGISTMHAETRHVPVNPDSYKECLIDWGWSAQDQPVPEWYVSAA